MRNLTRSVGTGTLLPGTKPRKNKNRKTSPAEITPSVLFWPVPPPRSPAKQERLEQLRASTLDLRSQLCRVSAKERRSPLYLATKQEIEILSDEVFYIEKALSPDSPLGRGSANFMLEVTRPQRPDGKKGCQWLQSFEPTPEEATQDFLLVALMSGDPFKITLNGVKLASREGTGWKDRFPSIVTIYGNASEEMLSNIAVHIRPPNYRDTPDHAVVPLAARTPFEVHLAGRCVVKQ